MRKPNAKGCKPTEDVCMEHESPLVCRHGCQYAAAHGCVTETPMLDELARKINRSPAFHGGAAINETKFSQTQAVKAALGNLNWHSIVGPNGECECAANMDGESKWCGDDLMERVMTLVDNCREYERISNGIQGSNIQ